MLQNGKNRQPTIDTRQQIQPFFTRMEKKNPLQSPNRVKSFSYALEGLVVLIRTEANARLHLLAFVMVVCAGLYFGITAMEWALIFLCSGVVLSAEYFNTAIERICDHVTPQVHPDIKIIKDLAAAGVLVIAMAALAVGILVFYPYIIEVIS